MALSITRLTALITVLSAILLICLGTVPNRVPSRLVLPKGDLERQVSNQTLGFQKIIAIHPRLEDDRRDAVTLAAMFSNLTIEWSEGKTVASSIPISVEGSPAGEFQSGLNSGSAQRIRSHMSAIRTVVEQNLTTALIIQDDADWDIRLKSQLCSFGRASRALTQPLKLQPSKLRTDYMDTTFPGRANEHVNVQNFDISSLPETRMPTGSPYGDEWDLLWLGHCGTRFPDVQADRNHSLGRVVFNDDETVPEHVHFRSTSKDLQAEFPPHTRVYHHPRRAACAVAYAVTQRAARWLLYEFGVRRQSTNFDNMLREYCDGSNGRPKGTCLTSQPPLLSAYVPIDREGAIGETSRAAPKVRLSTRVNLPLFLAGKDDFVEEWSGS